MLDQINERLEKLLLALKYSSEKTAMLSSGERIGINQERGHLMREKAKLENNETYQVEWYGQPEKIERKLTTISDLIESTGWEPKKENQF